MRPSFQAIETERIRLRCLNKGDAEALQAYRSAANVARYQSWDTDFSLKMANDLIVQSQQNPLGKIGSWTQLGIASRENDRVIGDIGVLILQDHAEIGYSLDPEHQGRGIATEALSALLEILHSHYGVSVVRAKTDARNEPSRRLLHRLGFEERSSAAAVYKGESVEEMSFELIK